MKKIYFLFLGRMFQLDLDGKSASLGTLYSAYTNQFFGGISFWNSSDIEDNKDVFLQSISQLGNDPVWSERELTVIVNDCSEQKSLVTSSHGEDSSELDAYIAGGANLFGLLSATVTGSLKLLDKDKVLSANFITNQGNLITQEKDDSAKFVLSYRAKTKEEMLTSQLLANINKTTCQEVADIGLNLTHFVVGVSYGGSCDITFKQVSGFYSFYLSTLYPLQRVHDIDDLYLKRFKLTATIKILFVSKTFSLLDISETDEYKKLTKDLELKVINIEFLNYFSLVFHVI